MAHHEIFKNEDKAIIELVKKLSSLNFNLTWRPLGEILRRNCRYRLNDSGLREYWMFASEIWIENDGHGVVIVTVRKKEDNVDLISGINHIIKKLNGKSVRDMSIFQLLYRISIRNDITWRLGSEF